MRSCSAGRCSCDSCRAAVSGAALSYRPDLEERVEALERQVAELAERLQIAHRRVSFQHPLLADSCLR